ncbi:MAG: M14 family zinc carboxypeptidase [Candidatus Sericytochromatia bacterium]
MNIEIDKNIKVFLSFDEIRNIFHKFSKLPNFSIQELGFSEDQNNIELLSYIKNSEIKNNILLFGGEDASEPIFSQTIVWLISELSKNDSFIHNFNLNWYFISCINPDGYIKNKGWFNQVGDLKSFLENSWEDLHSRMIFWKTEERIEHKLLEKAIDIAKPMLIYNMHDESHFPADGYKFMFSTPIDLKLLKTHLNKIKQFMDISSEELVITDSYGNNPKFSIYYALKNYENTFIFGNESCGYKLVDNIAPKIFIDTNDELYKALKDYKKLQLDNYNNILDSSIFHTNLLIKSIEEKEEFNTKMLSITGYGLEYLINLEINDAKKIKSIFLNHINKYFKDTYKPIPVWQQVFTQLDFLFTMLNIKEI